MKQRTYRICLLSIVILALAAGIYFYSRMDNHTQDRKGALLVMEECDG